jgi:hypothetical protein
MLRPWEPSSGSWLCHDPGRVLDQYFVLRLPVFHMELAIADFYCQSDPESALDALFSFPLRPSRRYAYRMSLASPFCCYRDHAHRTTSILSLLIGTTEHHKNGTDISKNKSNNWYTVSICRSQEPIIYSGRRSRDLRLGGTRERPRAHLYRDGCFRHGIIRVIRHERKGRRPSYRSGVAIQ